MDLAPLLHRRLIDVTWVALDTEATGYSNVAARLVEIAGVKFRFLPGKIESPAVMAGAERGTEALASTGLAMPPEAIAASEPAAATPAAPGLGAAEAPAVPPPDPRARPPAEVVVLGTFAELVNPGVPIPEEVVAIHGITDDMVKSLPETVEVLDRFLAFAGDAVLIAHYVPFDLGAMAFALVRSGRGVPRLAAIDTFLLPKRLFPGAPNYALSTLVEYLDLPRAEAHRALPDAISTMELFRRCVGALGSPSELTVADVQQLAGPLLTFEQFAEIPYELPASLAPVLEAIERAHDLTIEYRGGSKGSVPRRVTPSHLFAREGALFVEGWCHLTQAPKSFRVDRIGQVTLVPRDPGAPVMRHRGSGHWVREGAAS